MLCQSIERLDLAPQFDFADFIEPAVARRQIAFHHIHTSNHAPRVHGDFVDRSQVSANVEEFRDVSRADVNQLLENAMGREPVHIEA